MYGTAVAILLNDDGESNKKNNVENEVVFGVITTARNRGEKIEPRGAEERSSMRRSTGRID